jgi:hypothetical protein
MTALVISADLIWPGFQFGCNAFTNAAAPALCGEDIEVPWIDWNNWPGRPPSTEVGIGEWPARI